MMTKLTTIPLTALLLAAPLAANEALDILEGRKDVSEVELPPLPEDETTPEAGDAVVFTPAPWAPSPLDSVWSRAIVYNDPSNRYLQEIAFMGHLQFGGAWGDAEVEGQSNDVKIDTVRARRARLGARLKVFGNTEIEAVGEFVGDSDYQRIERLRGKTRVLPNHYLTYGKFEPEFGVEQSKEPRELLTPEESLLANMLSPASTLGIAFSQDCLPWDWSIGWFSGDRDRYIPGWEGNGFLNLNLAYEAGEQLEDGNAIRTRWHLDYIYNMDGRKSESIPRYQPNQVLGANGSQTVRGKQSYRHMVSTGVEIEGERFAFESDFQLGNGGEANVWGLTLTPSYWAVPGMLKIVARYHYADTDEPGGLVGGFGLGSDPYYDSTPSFVGDEFHSFYVGANLHLYQDRLVILNGLEYALMKDEAGGDFETDAWILHSAARVSF